MRERVWVSRSEAETLRLGQCLAEAVLPPVWIGLDGALGAGKTRFVQGFAAGMGFSGRVQSPTFVIENRYGGRVPLQHQDLYRLARPDDEILAGWDENESGVILVEWARRAETVPDRAISIRIERLATENEEPDIAFDDSAEPDEIDPDGSIGTRTEGDLDFSDLHPRRFFVTWTSADVVNTKQLDAAVADGKSTGWRSDHG